MSAPPCPFAFSHPAVCDAHRSDPRSSSRRLRRRHRREVAPFGQENAAIRPFSFPSCNYSRALPFYPHRLCFPGIPVIPPVGLKFRTSVGLPESYSFEELEFATACNTDSMKEILRTFGQPDGWTATPIGLILRFGEGLDALKNLARSAETGLTMDEKAASLVCGTAQLGCAALPAAFPPPPARPLLSASCVRAPGGCSLRSSAQPSPCSRVAACRFSLHAGHFSCASALRRANGGRGCQRGMRR